MPAKSRAQFRFMQGIAHGMKPRGGKGPSKKVAREFIKGQHAKGLPRRVKRRKK